MKKILVIGATSSIAENCARIWASGGHALYLVARNEERLKAIAEDLKVRGASQADIYCTDLNELDCHALLLNSAEKKLGVIETVLIAHGTLSDQKACEQSVEETYAEITTNALSTISLLTILANYFETKKTGTIAVISSVAGDRGRASNYVYGSSKAMVTVFTSGLRQRLYNSNVSTVTIKLGFVDTPMTKSFRKGLMWSSPQSVAKNIVKAINKRDSEIYIPKFWWLVMLLIKIMPDRVFNRIKI